LADQLQLAELTIKSYIEDLLKRIEPKTESTPPRWRHLTGLASKSFDDI